MVNFSTSEPFLLGIKAWRWRRANIASKDYEPATILLTALVVLSPNRSAVPES
jgi:hypothetical protein